MGFPGYSYATNYISDLGVPYEGEADDGRALRSSRAALMNIGGFILDGVLFAAASVAAVVGSRPRVWAFFMVFALVHASGSILVGLVPGGPREAAAGIGHFHRIGAGMAIIGGNCALIAAGLAARRLGTAPAWRGASIALGFTGLVSLVLLETAEFFPAGLVERVSVYPITAWKIMTGLSILLSGGSWLRP